MSADDTGDHGHSLKNSSIRGLPSGLSKKPNTNVTIFGNNRGLNVGSSLIVDKIVKPYLAQKAAEKQAAAQKKREHEAFLRGLNSAPRI